MKQEVNSMQDVINQVKAAPNKQAALVQAYEILSKRYKGERVKTYTRIFELLIRNLDTLWSKQGFLHCNHINSLMIELPTKSGHFEMQQIQRKWTLVWYVSPHEYLKVDTGDKIVDVDVWGKNYGIPFGKHAYGFNTSLSSIEDN